MENHVSQCYRNIWEEIAGNPNAFELIKTNFIPMNTGPTSLECTTCFIMKVTSIENEGMGQIMQIIDNTKADVLGFLKRLIDEVRYYMKKKNIILTNKIFL